MEKLSYIGNVGSGFSAKDQRELLAKFSVLETDESPFEDKINLKGRKATWMQPELICEVHFTEMTKTGSLRHPVFKGLRTDKSALRRSQGRRWWRSLRLSNHRNFGTSTSASSKAGHLEIGGIQVPFTNLEKVYWPESGLH
jgi:bifunctional non-homologous end joining protein LigD